MTGRDVEAEEADESCDLWTWYSKTQSPSRVHSCVTLLQYHATSPHNPELTPVIFLCVTGRIIQDQMKHFSIDKEVENKAMMGRDYTDMSWWLYALRALHINQDCTWNQRLPAATRPLALLIKLIKKVPAWINWRVFFFLPAPVG